MIKLLAIDMDGTCLDHRKRITDRTMEALKRAADAGIMIVPTTGRSLDCIPHRLAEHKEMYRYVITSNGAQVVDQTKGESIFQAMIDKYQALEILDACRGLELGKMLHIDHEYLLPNWLFVLAGYIIYGKDAKGVRRISNVQKEILRAGAGVEEMQFYFLRPGVREKVKRILEAYPGVAAAYTKYYVEIFAKDASKGAALVALAEYLNIERAEIACIGDGENDLSMFEASGLRFAMGNAISELKKQADYVVASNDRDGVAEAVEQCLQKR